MAEIEIRSSHKGMERLTRIDTVPDDALYTDIWEWQKQRYVTDRSERSLKEIDTIIGTYVTELYSRFPTEIATMISDLNILDTTMPDGFIVDKS